MRDKRHQRSILETGGHTQSNARADLRGESEVYKPDFTAVRAGRQRLRGRRDQGTTPPRVPQTPRPGSHRKPMARPDAGFRLPPADAHAPSARRRNRAVISRRLSPFTSVCQSACSNCAMSTISVQEFERNSCGWLRRVEGARHCWSFGISSLRPQAAVDELTTRVQTQARRRCLPRSPRFPWLLFIRLPSAPQRLPIEPRPLRQRLR
jgi:hypothetical protein